MLYNKITFYLIIQIGEYVDDCILCEMMKSIHLLFLYFMKIEQGNWLYY